MKRYNMRDVTPYVTVHPDGEWVLYEDHVEAMKRIAGAPVAESVTYTVDGVRMSQLEYIAWLHDELTAARATPSASAPTFGTGEVTEEQWREEAHRASAQQAEPVAHVPVHPRNGPLWSDTIPAGSELQRSESYPRMALYAAPAPIASPADISQLLVVLGLAGVQVNGGTHGYPWTVKLPGASPAALTDEQIYVLAASAMGNPMLVKDLRGGFPVHTESDDWLKFARALLAASPADQVEDARDAYERAYRHGWISSAKWANRIDLVADVDSPAYNKDRDEAMKLAMSATPPAA